MPGQLHVVDYVVVGLYLAGTIAIGLWIGRRLKTGSDFFLAGRSLPWWAIGMSLVATDIGGTDVIGVGGAAYRYGLAVANFEWIGCVPAMIVGAFLFIPLFWRSGIYTIPEFMERRFNAATRSALAVCWLAFMACNLGIMLLASARMLQTLFEWPVLTCIMATALFAGIYTLAGGLAAVVYTDMLQCAVMIGGCLAVLVVGLADIGGWEGLQAGIAARGAADTHLQLILPVDTPSPFPWTGILFGLAMILSPAYWIGNQAIVQRSFGAKTEQQAKAAYLWGALLKNIIPLIIAVPGLIALVRFPELDDADQAFPVLVSHLLPMGAKGLFLAAFIAALMSSIDSYLNSASTIVTRDFYVRWFDRDASDRRLLVVGRLATAALVVWAVLFALAIRHAGQGIYAIFQTLMSFFQGPALAILLAGLLWRRATGRAAFAGFVLGVAMAILLYLLNAPAVADALGTEPLFQIEEPFLYISVWAFLTSSSAVIVGSLLGRPESEERLQYVVGWRGVRSPSKRDSAVEGDTR